jgi:hypothetical protein
MQLTHDRCRLRELRHSRALHAWVLSARRLCLRYGDVRGRVVDITKEVTLNGDRSPFSPSTCISLTVSVSPIV